MGNTDSNVTSGVKQQADTSSQKIYTLLDVKGGGQLVALMKEATSTKMTMHQLDERIRSMVQPFLYNGGEGKPVPVSQLVLFRNRERPKNKQLTGHGSRSSQHPSSPAVHHHLPDGTSPGQDGNKTDSILTQNGGASSHRHPVPGVSFDSSDHGLSEPELYRDVCWDLNQRGSVGETAIHLCFLNSSTAHAELAKRLIKVYPKLIDDYYALDEYYGENALHMAIVNEDPAMVKFLLDNGANYHERAVGNFFCPEDQKASRTDNLQHEWVEVATKTNYEGHVYWGEYPHSFAACLNQEECYRLLLAKGADPDLQDTNGNICTHIMNMFDMVYELGGSIDVVNLQGLTPLTLAAKLARQEIFLHMLKLHREVYWQLGNITCVAYPLEQIDTIHADSGKIHKESALNLVVYGEKTGHLEMMEGVLTNLLHAKWDAFIKFKFYMKFALFILYFGISMACFVLRPGPINFKNTTTTTNATEVSPTIKYANGTAKLSEEVNLDFCYLLNYEDDIPRLILELLTAGGAFLYIFNAGRELVFLGYHTFMENLMTVPSRVLFLISCSLAMFMIPLRLSCCSRAEDIVAVLVMICTAPYFLFFCRGFRLIGPIVVMVYKMILTDLLCFVTIYSVFVIGFSQAYYVIFLSHTSTKGKADNLFQSPVASILALFVMSLSEFEDIYQEFDNTQHPVVAKLLFIMYMALVGILLINMLIAMMGKTYQDIASRKNEWMRQWARIVLVVERGVTPGERLAQLLKYSQPMADGRRALVVRLKHDNKEKEELEILGELKATHIENRRRQMAGSNILTPKSTPMKAVSTISL